MKVGIDIIEIARVEKLCDKASFLNRILTKSEKSYVDGKILSNSQSKKIPYATIAGLFAAKEAVSKAIGVGLLRGVGFKDIEIVHDELGAPEIRLSGKAKEIVSDKKVVISISHDGGFAVAVCNIE